MNENSPLVSFIISVYNDEELIIDSLKSVVSQTYKNIEILILDDASEDDTLLRIKNFAKQHDNIRIYKNKKNIGLTKSLNFLLKKASGEYIARQDSDDVSNLNRIKEQIHIMKKLDLDFCGTRAKIKQNNKIVPNFSFYFPKSVVIKYKNPFVHGTLIFKKKVLQDIGGYDERFYYSQDYKLITDLIQKKYKFRIINKAYYILNYSDNISINFKNEQEYFASCARKGITPDF